MATTGCESVNIVPATPLRRPGRSKDALHALIEAFPLPCAVFARGSGEAVLANSAFGREFDHFDALPRRADFDAEFESLSEGEDGIECYAPRWRRWYRLVWRSLMWRAWREPAKPSSPL